VLSSRSIRAKLLFAFVGVALLCAAVGTFAYSGFNALSGGMKTIYDDRVVPMAQIREIADGYHEEILAAAQELRAGRIQPEEALVHIRTGRALIETNWNAYIITYLTPEESKLVEQTTAARKVADQTVAELEAAVAAKDVAKVTELVDGKMLDVLTPIHELTDELSNLQVRVADEEVQKGKAVASSRILWMVIITLTAMVTALSLGLLLSRLIVTPLNAVRDAARRIAVGDVDQDITHHSGDELGQLADAARDMVAYNKAVAASVQLVGAGDLSQPFTQRSPQDLVGRSINEVRERLNAIIQATATLVKSASNGDLKARGDEKAYSGAFRSLIAEVNGLVDAVATPMAEANTALTSLAGRDLTIRMNGAYRGDFATMQKSFNSAAAALEETLTEVKNAAEQVAAAASEIQQTSQQLATGASEQASALEQVSASLQESVAGAKRSAVNTNEATALAGDAQGSVRGGTDGMTKLSSAMERIKSSTDQTARILRTIDEIAFQTNLLALNAAVEAARAGDAGRGFAVVADEVRNLAIRSADAAKQTSALIEQSLTSAEEGVSLNGSVVHTFSDIDGKVKRVGSVVTELAQAAEGQARGAQQIGIGVEEVSKVTQQNAAAAEEAAAAAQELSSQAQALQGLVGQFQLGVGQTSVKQTRNNYRMSARQADLAAVGNSDDDSMRF
jgi:methyl-accepting chemotaxis protein